MCPTTSQNPSRWHPSWLSTGKDPESERLAEDNLEISPITITPETSSRVAEQCSWVPLPNKGSCFVRMCVSLDNSFLNVRQKPTLEP